MAPTQLPPDRLLTLAQAADRLQWSVRTLQRSWQSTASVPSAAAGWRGSLSGTWPS